MYDRDTHYCKHCGRDFRIEIAANEAGDFFLVCPECKWPHYRRFENGVAVHTDLTKRTGEPIEINGR